MYFLLKIGVFHCYVNLPEGKFHCQFCWKISTRGEFLFSSEADPEKERGSVPSTCGSLHLRCWAVSDVGVEMEVLLMMVDLHWDATLG